MLEAYNITPVKAGAQRGMLWSMAESDRLETPPPPNNISLREWFVGMALANPEVMREVAPDDRAKHAVKIADDMMAALAVPKELKLPTFNVPQHPTKPEIPAAKLRTIRPRRLDDLSSLPAEEAMDTTRPQRNGTEGT